MGAIMEAETSGVNPREEDFLPPEGAGQKDGLRSFRVPDTRAHIRE
jgi:hypothetical protein